MHRGRGGATQLRVAARDASIVCSTAVRVGLVEQVVENVVRAAHLDGHRLHHAGQPHAIRSHLARGQAVLVAAVVPDPGLAAAATQTHLERPAQGLEAGPLDGRRPVGARAYRRQTRATSRAASAADTRRRQDEGRQSVLPIRQLVHLADAVRASHCAVQCLQRRHGRLVVRVERGSHGAPTLVHATHRRVDRARRQHLHVVQLLQLRLVRHHRPRRL
mmetsp:Transcript_28121/g.90851  ORF Transcript_28121/g.90851 Transcript_28121/m.90851 type:complete len:218 (-) Transcript_28121:789-1442(-)